MNLSLKAYKQLWALLAIVYFALGYLTINWFSSTRTYFYDVAFPFEQAIPFISVFILGYLLVYLAIAGLLFLIDDRLLFKKNIQAFFLLTMIHFLFFVLMPVKMGLRPVISENASGTIDILVRLYYWIDAPYNCFPSLHVAYTFLGALVLWNYKRGWRYAYLAATLIVSISVILVKQHYIADVIGGYITPLIVWIIVRKM